MVYAVVLFKRAVVLCFVMDKKARQTAMRARFPYAAEVTDALRAEFGPQVAPTFMQQGDDTWGKLTDESRYTVIHAGQMVLDTKWIDERVRRRGR